MKTLSKLLMCLFVCAPFLYASAANDKYFIPDPAFRTALKAAYPTCFTASDSLIKSCANTAIKNNLNVIGKNISSFQGIEYFTNLKTLYCSFNNLSTIPALPGGLTFIDASRNCFCGSVPTKPAGIATENWIVEPNKTSCLVHVTVKESEYETPINTPVTLKVGKSLSFDGIDDYYTLPGLPNTAGPFTIEFWAKPTQLPVQLNYNEIKDIVNQWNHIAIIRSGSTAPIQIYQNGVLRVTKAADATATLTSLVIGLGSNKYFGLMNDLKIWQTVRTTTELKASMFSFSDYANPNLVGAWNLSAHAGTVLKDLTTKGNNGTSFGCTWLNEDNSFSFKWTPSAKLNIDTTRNVTFTSAVPGIFNYTVTATNTAGCKASKDVKVKVFQNKTLVIQPGAEGKDALVAGTTPAGTFNPSNFGNVERFWAFGWTSSGSPVVYRSLVRFDLSTVPQGVTINSATIKLYADNFNNGDNINGHSNATKSNASFLKRITSAWEENTVTWNNQPTTTAIGQVILPQSTSGSQDYLLNVTSHIADMYQNPSSNNGFMLQLQTESYYCGLFFASGDHPNPLLHPKLEITYKTFEGEVVSNKFNVPDTNFRKELKSFCPECFDASGLLIINAANAKASTSLNVANKGISSIEGTEYFTNLKSLYCSYNNIKAFPKLPEGLTLMDAVHNCFCPSMPFKPSGIADNNWKILPNKSSCIVHVSPKEPLSIADINVPFTLKVGKSLSFDGLDDYYTLPGIPNTAGPFTVEFWAKPAQLPAQLNYPELSEAVGQWNHFAITRTGSAAPILIYQNGELKVTKAAGSEATLDSMVIGLGNNKYKGQMNDLRIWLVARPQDLINTYMNSLNNYDQTGIIGHWRMSAISGTVLTDYSPSGHHGTQYGCKWINEDNSHFMSWSPSTNLAPDTGRNVTFNSSLGGTYNYTLTATSTNGCKGSQNVKVVVKDPNIPGISFQSPIDLGEISQTRRSARSVVTNNPDAGFVNYYYSFTLKDSAEFITRFTQSDSYWEVNGIASSRAELFDSSFNSLNPDVYYRYFHPSPGRYYLKVIPPTVDDIPYFAQQQTTQIVAEYCANLDHVYYLNNATVISDAAGACMSYTDNSRIENKFDCAAGRYVKSKQYYKITLDSTRTLKVNICGSLIGNFREGYATRPIMDVLDNSGNKLSVNDTSFYCLPYDDFSYPVFIGQLAAGTYYILLYGSSESDGDFVLNVSTDGPSCPINARKGSIVSEVNELAADISIFPNPASGKTTLSIPGLRESVPVKITDLSGKTVQILVATSSLTEINTENLTDGMYYVSFTNQDKGVIQKLRITK